MDEAHCIPEWLGQVNSYDLCNYSYVWFVYRGSDFRTAFMSIGGLRALTDVPFMALSASAPPSIAKSIEDSLHLKTPVHIFHSLDRPNVFLSYAKSMGLTVSNFWVALS